MENKITMTKISLNVNKINKFLLFLIMTLPGCCLLISNVRLRFSIVIFAIFSFFYTLIKFKKCVSDIIIFFKTPVIKILLLWMIWCFLSGFISCVSGNYKWGSFLFYFIYHMILSVVPCYLGFLLIRQNSITNICKYYYLYVFIMLIIGSIDFILLHSGIWFLENFFDTFIVNTRRLAYGEIIHIARTKSVFTEPSYFANFICFNLPLIYEFSKNKYKIFRSSFLDIILKKSMFILAWWMIIATLSPIFLIFAVLFTIIYFFITSKRTSKLIFLLSFGIMFIVAAIILSNINIQGTYLERISKTLASIHDIRVFIYAETSLATRIISICNQFIIALQHPILGIGYGNIERFLLKQLESSPLPLTPQLISSVGTGSGANKFLFWTTLCETGFIGVTLLYAYFIKTIHRAKILLNHLYGYDKAFISSCIFMLTYQIVVFLYDGEFAGYFSFILGIIAGINIYYKTRKER